MLREGEIVFPRKEYNNWLFNTKCSLKTCRSNIIETGCIKNIYVYTHMHVTIIREKSHEINREQRRLYRRVWKEENHLNLL